MISIRNFEPGDADKICDFKNESVRINFPGCRFDREMFKRLLIRNAKTNPDNVKVVEDGGKLAGYQNDWSICHAFRLLCVYLVVVLLAADWGAAGYIQPSAKLSPA